ncbi:hypothetical protein RHO15_07810 [Utexia brackfieldae]|uniref:hypothetical protein n=1 Tax=Utexia brackfieldae TaxID=3074108 RepID=UPI00370D3286
MIEIIILIFLCRANYKNAKARGKSGGLYIAITLALWIVLELIGIAIGMSSSTYPNMLQGAMVGLVFAVAGGIISYYLAKSGPVMQKSTDSDNHLNHTQPTIVNQGKPNKRNDEDSNIIV